MDADDERRYATHGHDAGHGRCCWARARWGTGESSSPPHRATVPPAARSGAVEYGRPPQRQPARGGSGGDLPTKLVHFVSAAVPSGASASSSGDLPPPQQEAMSSPAPAPGSLASNTVVAKMMKRMNYKEGAGLGRRGQGIVAPIEVIPRPKNAGLGTAEGSIAGAFDPPTSSENWPKWDDVQGAKKQKRRRHHQELDDDKILSKPLDESAAEAVARVHKALARASRWSSGGPSQGEETTTTRTVIGMAMDRVQTGTLTTAELVREFTVLKEKCPREYTAYRLADAARAIVAPLLRAAFRHWDPLEDPSRGLEAMTKLKDTLLDDELAASPYAALVDDVVVGAVLASSAAETWDARHPEPMVRFLEMWGKQKDALLPPPAMQRIVSQVVMPKLSAAVESWDPGWDAVPCHAWVLPWIPLLGQRMLEPVYETVRGKLGEALGGGRHAARASAVHGMVAPWKDAFGPAAWGKFVDGHVVPYLRRGIRAVRVVTPPAPRMKKEEEEDGGLGWVVRWAPVVVSAPAMARLLEEEGFFGRWQDALRRWLWDERPGVEEALAWHEGWKRVLTPELLADDRVRVPIEVGLQTITRAAKGLGLGTDRALGPGRRQHAGEGESFRYVPPRRAPPVGYGRNRRQY
ncbi:hypothetical protein HU200_032518 [Digitaria exilis]|uniref:G-patch domain-containing protein n=1 Tax=Digitaria exilis TaxID=1010633 RepID=A0A835BMT4_9POAL|nr:hypothetical protein HU200_032518 [Digitaria exilis]